MRNGMIDCSPGTIIRSLPSKICRLASLLMLLAISPSPSCAETPSGSATAHAVILSVCEVALLQLQDASPMVLTIDPRTTTALVEDGRTVGTKRLCYTAVNGLGKTRTIMVQWALTDAAPPGASLRIRAISIPAGCGVAAGEVTVSSSPQELIRGIPSCATGTSSGGTTLQYRAVLDDPSRGAAGGRSTVTITYTISDDT
jgi:hypothetical protein